MLEPMTESLNPEIAAQHHRGVEPAPGATALPDLLLVERARGKEIRAFETLMRRYNQRLFRIARSIVAGRGYRGNRRAGGLSARLQRYRAL